MLRYISIVNGPERCWPRTKQPLCSWPNDLMINSSWLLISPFINLDTTSGRRNRNPQITWVSVVLTQNNFLLSVLGEEQVFVDKRTWHFSFCLVFIWLITLISWYLKKNQFQWKVPLLSYINLLQVWDLTQACISHIYISKVELKW